MFSFHSALSLVATGTPVYTDHKHIQKLQRVYTQGSKCTCKTKFSSSEDYTKPGLGNRQRQLDPDKKSEGTSVLEVSGSGWSKMGAEGRAFSARLSVDPHPPGGF